MQSVLNINEKADFIYAVPKEEKEIVVTVTAYNENDNNTPGTIMASGKKVYEGAVAYNNVPLGTKIIIDNEEYVVEDRVKWDNVVDIYKSNIDECNEFGVQKKIIRIMEE
jgi:3D (Asp-Asp-Asp) domain-containing protein